MKGKKITNKQAEAMVNSWSDEKVLCMLAILKAALNEKNRQHEKRKRSRTNQD